MPRQSVTIFPAGDSAARIIALSAKAIDGTMLSYPDINEAMRLGMHEFAKMSDVKGSSFPMNVMVARRSFVGKKPRHGEALSASLRRRHLQFMNNKEKGLAVLGQTACATKIPKAIEETYQYFAKSFAFPTRVSHEGLRNTLETHRPAQSRRPKWI